MKATILIVDDEAIVRRTLSDALTRAGFDVISAGSGEEALKRIEQPGIDLVLLDLQLGDLDGVTVMQSARQRWPNLPIVMLTAHGSLTSAIEAVRAGASDYLLKPISIDALRERINLILQEYLQRQQRTSQLRDMYEQMRGLLVGEGVIEVGHERPIQQREFEQTLEAGPLRIDMRRHCVWMHNAPMLVTPSEFAILATLLREPDAVVSCRELAHATHALVEDEEEARQLIRPHIGRLRRKLEEDPQQPCYIISVRGVGYRWNSEHHDKDDSM